MSLELATAFLRVKTDRAQLRTETEATRKFIMRRLSGITIPITLKVSNLAAIQRELRGFSVRVGQNVGQQVQAGMNRGMRGAPTSAAAQAAAAGMMMGSPPLTGRGGRAVRRAAAAQTFPQQLASALAIGGQSFNRGPSGGVFAGMGQLTPQQFRNRAKLLNWSNQLRAQGGGRGGGGQFFAGGRFSRMGGMGAAGRFASGFGFATAPMLTAGAMFGGGAGAAGMGAGMAVAGAGRFAVDQGVQAVRTFADFEKDFRRVEVVQREAGAMQEEIDKLRAQARNLGRTTIFSSGEAAEAMVLLSQRGFSATEVFEQMPATLNLAAAGQLDLAAAADIASSSLRLFGMQSKDTQKVADIMTTAFLESAANVEDVAVALRFIGPSARIAGKGMAETVAGIMALRNAGMTPSMAGTAMDRVLTFMGVPQKRAKMEAVGIHPVTDKGEIISIANFLEQSAAAMEKMTEAERLAFQNDVFGFRGGKGFGALLATQASEMEQQVERLGDSAGKAGAIAGEMMSTVDAQMKEVADSVQELRIALVEGFGDDLRNAIGGTAAAIRAVSDAVKDARENASGGAGGGGLFGFFGTMQQMEQNQRFLDKLREVNKQQEQNRIKARREKLNEAFGPDVVAALVEENPREAFAMLSKEPAVREALSGLVQRGMAGMSKASAAAPAAGILSPALGSILEAVGGGPGAGRISGMRMGALNRSGIPQMARRFGFDVMENVQNGGIGNALAGRPGSQILSPDQRGIVNQGLGALLNQVMPGAGSLFRMIPGGADSVVGGIKGLASATSAPSQRMGGPGIFGLEEFHRQVQMGALGPDKGMAKVEENTGKTEENTDKTNIILNQIKNQFQDFLGLG